MRVNAAENTFNVQFVHRVQKLANETGKSTGEAAIELLLTTHAPPPDEPTVEPAAPGAEPGHIDIEA